MHGIKKLQTFTEKEKQRWSAVLVQNVFVREHAKLNFNDIIKFQEDSGSFAISGPDSAVHNWNELDKSKTILSTLWLNFYEKNKNKTNLSATELDKAEMNSEKCQHYNWPIFQSNKTQGICAKK